MTIIMLILLLMPLSASVLFWCYALKRGWHYTWLFALITSLCLGSFTIIIWLLTNLSETWILWLGGAISVLIGLALLSMPVTLPEVTALFFKDGAGVKGNGLAGKNSVRKLLSAIFIFFYLAAGLGVFIYMLEPATSIQDLPKYWWVIAFALLMALFQLLPGRNKPQG